VLIRLLFGEVRVTLRGWLETEWSEGYAREPGRPAFVKTRVKVLAINIYRYTDYREYLKAYFSERKRNDTKFSHRYLSRRLGLASPNFIMMVMQGKRNITQQMAFRISTEFKLDPKETEYFENLPLI
jgi:hypothetical protein